MVFHGDKVRVEKGLPIQTWVNPPLSTQGMAKILAMVPTIKALGPFEEMFSSRLARAVDTASVLALELGLDFRTLSSLGQYGNKDGDDVAYYPLHEADGYLTWQGDGVASLRTISAWRSDCNVLAISHRPIIGGLIAHTRGITDEAGIKAIVNDAAITEKGYVVFEVENGAITLIE
ncbi:MAG: histidine phosphatase family protein [Candidatus Staskawiczbacteria bacterium]